MTSIAVIDYGMGNLRSVSKALEHVAPDADVRVTSDPEVVRRAGRVVFPGQGAMPACMREMDARGLRPAVLEAARSKPFLGICIGLQTLFERSEEGDTPGLGVFSGQVRRFPPGAMKDAQGGKLKVPHMGWNEVMQAEAHALWRGASPTPAVIISCTVITSRRASRNWWPGTASTVSPLPAPWRRIIFSLCNSTPRKVRPPALRCSPIS